MATDSETNLSLEIGHVLFLDIVGYSKFLINEQSRLLRALNEIVRGTAQFRAADSKGKLVRLATGDGMALVFRDSPETPAKCALEIAQALRSHPGLPLRMGIHSGPVSEVADVNERANIAGAGINLAQRAMDCGDAGHILLSKHVAEDLENYERWRPYLHDLGEVTVKHGLNLHLVNLYTDDLGNPQLPAKIQRERQDKTSLARAAKTKQKLKIWLFLGTILVFAVAILLFLHKSRRSSADFAPDKSIAVLPLENLSDSKENAFFADGIQDDVLSSLAKIKELKVIRRNPRCMMITLDPDTAEKPRLC